MSEFQEKPDWKHRFLSGWGAIAAIIFGTIAALVAVKSLLEL